MHNSRWQQFHYWNTYGSHPVAKHFAIEFKNLSDAEAAMTGYLNSIKRFNILDWIGDVWDDILDFMTKDREKERMEAYFSQAVDHADLERRQREWENRKFKKLGYYI